MTLAALLFISSLSFAQIIWELNNLTSIGGTSPTVEGDPGISNIVSGKAIEFDGVEDRIELNTNPLIGMTEFTVEAIFRVDKGGVSEQKIIHIQASPDIRILYEVEFVSENEWFLENYIQAGDLPEQKLHLADTYKVHLADAWYHAAVTYKEGHFIQYINGKVENTGDLTWVAPEDGVVSLGARQNQVGYMTGAIKSLKFTDEALSPQKMDIDYQLLTSPKLLLFNNLDSIGGYDLQIFGNPEVIETKLGKAIEFDGDEDGIYIKGNPLFGTEEFTIESVFKPYASYPSNIDPRYLHFEDLNDDTRRITMEYRLTSNNEWYFDGFIRSTQNNLPLIDENLTHSSEEWMHAAITYKDGTFKTYVNGLEELSGSVTYEALAETAIISAGMRMNKVNYMQGAIHSVRITHEAINPSEFVLAEVYDTTTITEPPSLTQNLFEDHQLQVRVYGTLEQGLTVVPQLETPGTIDLRVFDINGQLILAERVNMNGSSSVQIETHSWKPGLFVLQILANDKAFSGIIPLY